MASHDIPSVEPADLAAVVSSLRQLLPTAPTPWPGGYPDQVELALIDAVLSVRARYGQHPTASAVRSRSGRLIMVVTPMT